MSLATMVQGLASSWSGMIQQAAVARTATADGLTTGIVAPGTSAVAVTSANSAHLLTLPVPVVNNSISFMVGANGFRLQSDTPGSVSINGVSGGGTYLTIAANSYGLAIALSTTAWVVLVWSSAGAPVQAAATITTATITTANITTGNITTAAIGTGTASVGFQSTTVARTATADGLTTGVIAPGSRNISVTSANAAHLMSLPAPVVDNVIDLGVTTNGYRLQTSDPATIGINGVTPGGGTYLQIPANTRAIAICTSATTWIVITFNSAGALTSGVAAVRGQTISPRLCHTGGIPAQVSTDGTELDIVVTELYVGQVYVPADMTVTGVSIMTGTNTNGNAKVCLFDSAGVRVAISASTDVSSFAADSYNDIAFSAAYSAKGPATYYVGIICDDNTNDLNTHTFGKFNAGKITGLVYATEAGYATITPPSTFTTALAPIASLY